MTAYLPALATIPRPVIALLALALYGAIVRWRISAPALLDLALLGLLIYRPSLGLAAWVGALLIVRHTPALAADVVALLRLDCFDGWTARLVVFALPALRSLMVSGEDEAQKGSPDLVHVPVPRTDTKAIEPPDRDITRDLWIRAMALARDEKGKYIYSANDIHDANHGHRATVLARVKEFRSDAPEPQFRQDDGTSAPAAYPVTSQKAAP